jgi:DNA-directed RNA polymerase subunit RPC12/RpoP
VIEFECLGCGTTFDVSESLVGKVIKCRECHQPGKVHAPFDAAPRTKGPDKPDKAAKAEKSSPLASLSSSLKGSYQCPYCGTRVLWEWRRCWTPSSTVLLLVGGYAIVYASLWAYHVYQRLLSGNVTEIDTTISPGHVIGGFVLLAVAVTVAVMSFRLLFDWRQVCPRCGVRSG